MGQHEEDEQEVKSGESALDIARAYFPLQQSQEELPNAGLGSCERASSKFEPCN